MKTDQCHAETAVIMHYLFIYIRIHRPIVKNLDTSSIPVFICIFQRDLQSSVKKISISLIPLKFEDLIIK
jgi:hypothetical protein